MQTYTDSYPVQAMLSEQKDLRFIGHVWRRLEECSHQLLFWEPNNGKRSRDRLQASFFEQSMQGMVEWRRIVKGFRVRSIDDDNDDDDDENKEKVTFLSLNDTMKFQA